MRKKTEAIPYAMCVGALLWLVTSAFSAPPPNASGCPGTVQGGVGTTGTLSCGSAACLGNGTCAMTTGHAIPPNPPGPKITLYHYDPTKNPPGWVRTGGAPPQGSTTSVCECAKPDPQNPGHFLYTPPNPACCHLVEVNYPNGHQHAATKGTCAACPQNGRCDIASIPATPAIGEADCVVNN